jgi:pimeloyl-ACP methyl ester carboxylesterase
MQSIKNPQVAPQDAPPGAGELQFRQPLSGPTAGLQALAVAGGSAASHDRVMVPMRAEAERLQLPGGRYLAYHRRNLAANDREADGINSRRQPPGIVFLGGFASDMTGTKAMALDAYCAATGRAFVRFDYSGHGQSSGKFVDGTIGAWRDDVLAVLDQLTQGPQILIGSSMGGWLMLLASLARPDRIHALIGLAPAPDFTEELMWQTMDAGMQQRLMQEGRIEEPSAYSDEPYVITRALIEDGRKHLLLQGAIHIDRPVRLIHGQADQDVPFSVSLRLADHLVAEDVAVTLVKDGDHRLSRQQDIERLIMTIEEVS